MRQDGLERLVDANANRVREGLRTLEDLARFVLDASDLARDLKTIRHEITEAAARLVGPTATPRDTAGDVGTEHMTDGELARPGLVAVAEAAGGRVTEGCRSLEEAAKVLDVGGRVASALQSARYAAYDLAAAVTAAVARGRPSGWRVQVLLTESICRGPWTQVLESAIAGGADAIQVREKSFSSSELLDRVRSVIEIARPAGIPVIVNDRADVAVAAGADGVHLGQGDLPVEAARRVVQLEPVAAHELLGQVHLDAAHHRGGAAARRALLLERHLATHRPRPLLAALLHHGGPHSASEGPGGRLTERGRPRLTQRPAAAHVLHLCLGARPRRALGWTGGERDGHRAGAAPVCLQGWFTREQLTAPTAKIRDRELLSIFSDLSQD